MDFKAIVFSDSLTILLEHQDSIDYSAIKTFLDGSNNTLEFCEQLRLHAATGYLVVRGYKLSNGMYITSKESDSYYSIKYNLEMEELHQCLKYMAHMHESKETTVSEL
jgi:hypothetical protein